MTDQQKWIIANYNRHFNRGFFWARLTMAGVFFTGLTLALL